MSDDLNELSEDVENVEQGGAGEEQRTTVTEHVNVDFTTLPDFKAWQSKKDTETAQERAARIKAENEAATLRNQLGLVLETIQADPDQATVTARQLELIAERGQRQAAEAELARRNAEDHNRELKAQWESAARAEGIDPNGEEFQKMWNEAVQRQSSTPFEVMMGVHRALKSTKRPDSTQEAAQEDTVTVKKPASAGYTPPPAGGARKVMTEADKAAANQRLQDLYRAPTGHDAEIKQLEKLLGM